MRVSWNQSVLILPQQQKTRLLVKGAGSAKTIRPQLIIVDGFNQIIIQEWRIIFFPQWCGVHRKS